MDIGFKTKEDEDPSKVICKFRMFCTAVYEIPFENMLGKLIAGNSQKEQSEELEAEAQGDEEIQDKRMRMAKRFWNNLNKRLRKSKLEEDKAILLQKESDK